MFKSRRPSYAQKRLARPPGRATVSELGAYLGIGTAGKIRALLAEAGVGLRPNPHHKVGYDLLTAEEIRQALAAHRRKTGAQLIRAWKQRQRRGNGAGTP